MANQFEQQCEEIAHTVGVKVEFFRGKEHRQAPFYDDGCIFIYRRGVQACFDVDQDARPKVQNRRTRTIMTALGEPVTDRVLTDEECHCRWECSCADDDQWD